PGGSPRGVSAALSRRPSIQQTAETASAMGIFGKIKEALGRGVEKTKTALATDIRDLFKKQGRLVDESFLDDLQEILIKSDMGVAASQEIIDEIKSQFRARKVEMEDVLDIVRNKLRT